MRLPPLAQHVFEKLIIDRFASKHVGSQRGYSRHDDQSHKLRQGPGHFRHKNDSRNRRSDNTGEHPRHPQQEKIDHAAFRQAQQRTGSAAKDTAAQRAKDQQREEDPAGRAGAEADHRKYKLTCQQKQHRADEHPFAAQPVDDVVAAAQHLRKQEPEQAREQKGDRDAEGVPQGQLFVEFLGGQQGFVEKRAETAAANAHDGIQEEQGQGQGIHLGHVKRGCRAEEQLGNNIRDDGSGDRRKNRFGRELFVGLLQRQHAVGDLFQLPDLVFIALAKKSLD